MDRVHLCPREVQVMQLLAQGQSTSFIAYQLGISVARTYQYIAEAMKKTDSCSRTQCVAKLVSLGIVTVNAWVNLATGDLAE